MTRKISLDDFLKESCGPCPTCIPFIRATAGMSDAALRRARATFEKELQLWHDQVQLMRKEYLVLLNAGQIISPTPVDTLQRVASGHQDNESTQAAQRVLEKRAIRLNT